VPTISGYAAGENVKIEYRWVETRYERLPSKGFGFARASRKPAFLPHGKSDFL
jgi:hypothetical protein